MAVALDPEVRRRHVRRAVIASAVGTSIEWYDFFLYGVAAALVFPQRFFPPRECSTLQIEYEDHLFAAQAQSLHKGDKGGVG